LTPTPVLARLRSSSPRTGLRSIGLVAVCVAVLAGCWSGPQGNDMDLINGYRQSRGGSTLAGDQAAMDKAQAWSRHMAQTGVLEHTGGGTKLNTNGVSGWCSYYENVAYGSSLAAVHASLVASDVHRANMLSTAHRVGTGVYQQGSTVWVTEIYLRNC